MKTLVPSTKILSNAMLLVALFVWPQLGQPLHAAIPASPKVSDVDESARIAYYHAHEFTLKSDRLYTSSSERGYSYDLVPIWEPEVAIVIGMMQTSSRIWCIKVRTASGLEGYLEVHSLDELEQYLQATGE